MPLRLTDEVLQKRKKLSIDVKDLRCKGVKDNALMSELNTLGWDNTHLASLFTNTEEFLNCYQINKKHYKNSFWVR